MQGDRVTLHPSYCSLALHQDWPWERCTAIQEWVSTAEVQVLIPSTALNEPAPHKLSFAGSGPHSPQHGKKVPEQCPSGPEAPYPILALHHHSPDTCRLCPRTILSHLGQSLAPGHYMVIVCAPALWGSQRGPLLPWVIPIQPNISLLWPLILPLHLVFLITDYEAPRVRETPTFSEVQAELPV